jgi:anti-anti-sigma factor
VASFALQSRDFEGVRILAVSGEIDARAARDLQRDLLGAVSEGQRALLVDLDGAAAVAAAGLRVFVAIGERLAAEGGGLALCAPNPAVLKVIETAGMDRTLSIHRGRDQAVEWLRDTVRQGRVGRLAGKLLRRRDESGRPLAGIGPRASADRSTLAASLLGIEETARRSSGGSAEGAADGEPDPPQ